MSPVYVYALTDPTVPAPDVHGFAGRIRALVAAGVAAMVEPMGSPLLLTPEALRTHDRVVRAVATHADAVAPCRFGTWLPDEASLRGHLEDGSFRLRALLERVRGCEQMTLRVFTNGSASPPPEDPPDEGSGPDADVGPGTRYLTRRMRQMSRQRDVPGLKPILASLGPFVRAERIEPHAEPPLVASVYHLVARTQSEPYVKAIQSHAGDPRLRLQVSGPWPPYAFAQLEGT